MKILFIGDIVGEPGRAVLKRKVPELIEREKADFVVANGENAAGGKGITGAVAGEIFDAGVNVITLGNHSFDRREAEAALDNPRILRPANYPEGVRGNGYGIYTAGTKGTIAVISLMGRVYLPLIDCPFRKASALLEKVTRQTRAIIVDFHAEVTSEKVALGWYLDGRVSAVIGTHTHVPTADERILPGGTACITDAGMTGPTDGVIGMDRELVLKKFLTGIPQHFEVAKGTAVLQGCRIDIDESTGRSVSIARIAEY